MSTGLGHHDATGPPVSGVRAARERLGLTQRQVAERIQVPLDTFQNWDRDENRPSDPADLQLLAFVLETPLDVLYPPDKNPRVARVLREHLPTTVAPVVDAEKVEALVAADAVAPPDEPIGSPVVVGEPDVADRRPRSHRWVALLAACGVLIVAAVLVLVMGRDESPPVVDHGDARAAEVARQHRATQAAIRTAANRRDFDRAIVLAEGVQDERAAARYRAAAAMTLVRRADMAASRGDLPLARARLRKARARYRTAPGASKVNAHIHRIERDRRRRAAARRARKQAAAAAAARRQAAAVSGTASTGSAASSGTTALSTTSTQQSDPTPTTKQQPKKDREKTVDPGLF